LIRYLTAACLHTTIPDCINVHHAVGGLLLHQWANLPACLEIHMMLLACALQPCTCVNGFPATRSSKRSTDNCVILSAWATMTDHNQLPLRDYAIMLWLLECQWANSKVGVSSWLCKAFVVTKQTKQPSTNCHLCRPPLGHQWLQSISHSTWLNSLTGSEDSRDTKGR